MNLKEKILIFLLISMINVNLYFANEIDNDEKSLAKFKILEYLKKNLNENLDSSQSNVLFLYLI